MTDLRKAAEMAFDLLCDAVEPTATQVQADIGMCAQWDVDAIECIEILRQALAQPEQDDDAYEYAKRLAECIWEKYYKEESPHWRPFHDVLGVLTQIDNMTCGLEKAQPEQEPVAYWNGKDMFKRADEFQYVVNWTDYYHYPLYSKPVKERISEPVANLEPVAWVSEQVLDKQFMPDGSNRRVWWEMSKGVGIPLYTAPPKQWVGLTDDEILDCYEEHLDRTMFLHRVKSIEAKIKEKNT